MLVLMIISRFRHGFLPLFTLLALWGVSIQGTQAQRVFNYEMQKCIERQWSTRCGFAAQRLAFFQQNALMYIWHQTAKREKNRLILYQKVDRQAYFLAEFITVYCRLTNNEQLTEAQHEQWKRYFTETSLRHPMFNDPDESVTLQFVDKEGRSSTPFSLDTNWETAHHEITQRATQEGLNLMARFRQ